MEIRNLFPNLQIYLLVQVCRESHDSSALVNAINTGGI